MAGKQLVNLRLNGSLIDALNGLTGGRLIRNSDATYVNTSGQLAYSRGTRANLVLHSEDTSQAAWASGTTQTFTLTVDTTYLLSVHKEGVTLTLAAGTGAYTVLSGTTATYGNPVAFTMTAGGTVTVTTDTTNPKAQLEVLPSGNVIGPDLMDQEVLGSELITNGGFDTDTAWTKEGTWTISGGVASINNTSGSQKAISQVISITNAKIYKLTYTIVSISGDYFYTVLSFSDGSNIIGPNRTASGTYIEYFISSETTNRPLYLNARNNTNVVIDNVSVKEVIAPAKGQYHNVAMLAGSTELVANNSFETAGGGGADVFANWTETYGGSDTIVRGTTKYKDTYAAHLTHVNNGATYVDNAFAVTAGRLYKAEFWTRGNGSVGGRYQIRDNTGSADIVAVTATGVTGTTYTRVTKYFVAPPGCSSASIRLYAPSSSGTAYYDYVSVRQVPTAWSRYGTNTLEIDSAVGSGGALKVTYVDHASGAQISLADASDQTADLTVGETYQVSLKSRVNSGGSVNVEVRDSSDNVLASYTETATSLTDRTLYFKATHATTNKLSFSGLGSGESIWIDDLTVRAVPDLAYLQPGPYTPTTGSPAPIPAEPRFEANGLLVEGEGTNFVTYSCDFTNAAWVKTNVTAAKNQTGPDGTASAASLLTATANNGTVLMTIADGGATTNKTFSVWLKRLSGTGSIALTDNNGTNWTTQTITTSWAKYTLAPRSQATPIVGIRIATSGDSIAACLAQSEVSAFATSSIPTNGCPVTRLSEAGSATSGYRWAMSQALKNALGAAANPKGTMLVDITPGHAAAGGAGTAGSLVSVRDAAQSLLYYNYTNSRFESHDGTNTPNYPLSIASGTPYTMAIRWDRTANGGSGYLQVSYKVGGTWYTSTAGSQRTAFDADGFNPGDYLRLAFGNEYPFWIKSIRIYDGWVEDKNLDKPKSPCLFPLFRKPAAVKKYKY